ncbi:uncharacterized protein LOC143246243 isoform X2 [Tachypleus tridentatus]|uniref:uncharacterized protein LOC143246243 isoform X2 n=1 Tax=Tachypleus tridentatus TaxID=6853 RepID=UPI003FD5A89D
MQPMLSGLLFGVSRSRNLFSDFTTNMQNKTEKILDVTFETYIDKRVPEWKKRMKDSSPPPHIQAIYVFSHYDSRILRTLNGMVFKGSQYFKGQQVIQYSVRMGHTKRDSNIAVSSSSFCEVDGIDRRMHQLDRGSMYQDVCCSVPVAFPSLSQENIPSGVLQGGNFPPLSEEEYVHCLQLAQELKNVADDFEQNQKTNKSSSMKYGNIVEPADPEELSSEECDVIRKIRSLKTIDIPEIARLLLVCLTKKTLKLTLDYITGMECLTGYPSIALSFELAAVILATGIISSAVGDLVRNVCKTYVLNRYSSWFTTN